jgi:hypothetical protein
MNFLIYLSALAATATAAAIAQGGPEQPACTTTAVIPLSLRLSQTCTDYDAIESSTSFVDCGGCALATSSAQWPKFGGHGPEIPSCTTTTTLAETTETEYACLPTTGP